MHAFVPRDFTARSEKMKTFFAMQSRALLAIALAALANATLHAEPLMIVGLDEKVTIDDGTPILSLPGKDQVLVVDLANPEEPKIVASLPLKNSLIGPPVNLAFTPDGTLALIADSMDVVMEGGALKNIPDNKLYVVDMASSPPKHINTLVVGKQPSGLDISPDGKLAVIAHRADNSIGVISIDGRDVKLVDTVGMGDSIGHVAFSPDGRRAIATKVSAHKVSILDVGEDRKVTYTKLDLPTGQFPINVAVTPNGKIALTADLGNAAASDGSVDTISVVDLEAEPPRIIDRVVVGDGPEGLAISPRGDVAVAVLIRGSLASKNAFFYNKSGAIAVLRIEGKKVTAVKEIEVGALPEGAVFTPDGRYLLVGNYLHQEFSILRVNGTEIIDTGKRFKVPGHPASARMGLRYPNDK
jgi:DNA-binding beta-propeller fold protein YncE